MDSPRPVCHRRHLPTPGRASLAPAGARRDPPETPHTAHLSPPCEIRRACSAAACVVQGETPDINGRVYTKALLSVGLLPNCYARCLHCQSSQLCQRQPWGHAIPNVARPPSPPLTLGGPASPSTRRRCCPRPREAEGGAAWRVGGGGGGGPAARVSSRSWSLVRVGPPAAVLDWLATLG